MSKIYGLREVLVRLDRRIERTSVTSNKKKQFAATRELLRSFAYEYRDIISKEDYEYAMGTQTIMEVNHKLGFTFLVSSLKNITIHPHDPRFRKSLLNRLRKKF